MANENGNTGTDPELNASDGRAWNTANDKFEPLLNGRWAVVCTVDGWQIESQSCYTAFDLESTDMESAKIEGEKMALEIEGRFSANASFCNKN